jgi:hypothetical protein
MNGEIMRPSLFQAAVLSCVLGIWPCAFATKSPVPHTCESNLAKPKQSAFSQAARRAGVKFLLMKMSPKNFKQLIEAVRPGDEVQIEPRIFLDEETYFTFDLGFTPVFERDSGQWAHQLIRNGSDTIFEGVRYVAPNDWRIGFLFPVEVLDLINFDHQWVSSYGSGSPEEFESKLRHMAQNPPYPGSYNVEIRPTIKGQEGQTIPFSMARLIWIPAPLIVGTKAPFPGKGNPILPAKNQSFSMRISYPDSGTPHGWTDVVPPSDDGSQWLDPNMGLGTWCNVVPDWAMVDRTLKAAGAKGVDLARLASMVAVPGTTKAIGNR